MSEIPPPRDDETGESASGIYEIEPETEIESKVDIPDEPIDKTDAADKRQLAVQAERIAESRTPFKNGIGGVQFASILAGVLLLVALIMAGVRAGDTEISSLMLRLAHTLLSVAVNGAIGTLAALAAARMVGVKSVKLELFGVRMIAAAAAFEMLYQIGTPIPTTFDDWALGVAAYATTVWLLFRLPPKETGFVLAWHAGLLSLLWLYGWSSVGADAGLRKNTPQREVPSDRPLD